MANHSLPHLHENSYYQITLQDLENLHFKVNQSHSVLSILSDWITECSACSLSLEQKGRVDSVVFLLMDLLEQARKLLPQL